MPRNMFLPIIILYVGANVKVIFCKFAEIIGLRLETLYPTARIVIQY